VPLTSADVKAQAARLGCDLCGVATAAALPELQYLNEWLARGYAGEMLYMHRSADTRTSINRFLPTARSVIVTATLYHTGDAAPEQHASDAVEVARYARGRDYHVVLAERLEALVAWMRTQVGTPFDAAIFVDKHHVQERSWAAAAGLGWIGKNGCVIHPDLGSWFLLAGVAVSVDLAPDRPQLDQCGSCTLCLDSCPTGALVEPKVLDATRCLAYHTIELGGAIPEPYRAAVDHHWFGCDICQEVCPWNLAPPLSTDATWTSEGRQGARASALWLKPDHELHRIVDGSAMERTGVSRLRRTLALIIGNSGDPSLAEVLTRPGQGIRNAAPSADAPVVRDAVAWAQERLRGRDGRE
jgi:epoxyqueuosine reductase